MSETEIQSIRSDTALLRAQTEYKLALQIARVVDEGDRLASRNIYVVATLSGLFGASIPVAGLLFAKYVLVN